MSAPLTGRPDLIPGRSGPAIIAHGGGNSVTRAHDFLATGADFLEVDLWLHDGNLEARHERRVRGLPFLVEKWYLRRLPRSHYGLDELLAETADHGAGIFLDLKNGGPHAATLLRRVLARADRPRRVVASSQQWRTLRAIAEVLPDVDAFYSIDVAAKLELFFSIANHDDRPRGVSCRHSLLSGRIVESLHRRGLLVVAWTVDDLDRARELVSWGIDGLTTHKVAEMRAEFVK
ncbi:MAG: glycerophosphodiester phosphodiesterase [bacterium]